MENTVSVLSAARKDFSRMGLSLFVIIVLASLLQVVFTVIWVVVCAFIPTLNDSSWGMWLITFVPLYCIAIPVGLCMMRRIPAETLPGKKLSMREFFLLLLMCMPLMYGGNIIGNMLAMMISGGTAENALLDYLFDDPMIVALVTVGIAPFLEEYIFRKQIIDRCGKYGEKTAIFLSAFTFSLFHMNLFQMIYAFALGALFAFVYTRTRRLRYCVMLHMIINFIGAVVSPQILSMLDLDALNSLEMNHVDPAILPDLLLYLGYLLLLLGGSLVGLALLISMRKKFFLQPASQELPKEIRFRAAYLNTGMILFVIFCLIMTVAALFLG